MSIWRDANVAGKIELLRPLIAAGLKQGQMAARLGTSTGAIAGFLHYHPEAREAERADDRALFGDGVTTARIAVRIKARKVEQPENDPEPEPPAPPTPAAPAGDAAGPAYRPRRQRRPRLPAGAQAEARPEDAPAAIEPALAPAVPDDVPAPAVAEGRPASYPHETELSWDRMTQEQRIEQLRARLANRQNYREIAAELTTTRSAVAGYVTRFRVKLDLPPPAPQAPRRKATRPALAPARGVPLSPAKPQLAPVPRLPKVRAPAIVPKPAPLPPRAVPAGIVGGRVLLIDTGSWRCKWPTWTGRPTVDQMIACGEIVEGGQVYCTHHCRLAYQRGAAA